MSLPGGLIWTFIVAFNMETLDSLMKTNPPLLSLRSGGEHLCPKLLPPSNFYDPHIASKLLLKRVEILPLEICLSAASIHVLQSLKESNKAIPSRDKEDNFRPPGYRTLIPKYPVVDANSLAELYRRTTAASMSVVASTLLLHPDTPGWFLSANWNRVGSRNMNQLCAYTEDYSLKILSQQFLSKGLRESMDDITRAKLEDLRKTPGLAYWEIFSISPDADDVLAKMDTVGRKFVSDLCQAKGYAAQPLQLPPTADAHETGWGELVATFAARGDPLTSEAETATLDVGSTALHPAEEIDSSVPSSRNTKRQPPGPPNVMQWGNMTVPKHRDRTLSKSDMSRSFLQRAWAHSTEHDTTYTVFNCGNFERIGFRHRESGTLFLSNLINVPECEDPHYGKIQMGLYISIIQDALDRLKQQSEKSTHIPGGKRRKKIGTLPPNKRPRTRASSLKEKVEAEAERVNSEVVTEEARKRPLALLVLRYGIYNSPAPASFLRLRHIRKDMYTPSQYFKVVISSKIAAGATGTIHGADVEFLDGTIVRRAKAVVKLSFGSEQSARMRHEFSVYEHLRSCGVVSGIPVVYGLFEDLESDVLALVMSHVGRALVDRYPGFVKESKACLSEEVKSAFIGILRSIHEAGVRHNDIRAENLAITDDDRVSIIDFDKALLDSSEGAKRRELRNLEHALRGAYPAWYDMPSPATTPEA
ncbi:hypothetical protein DXG01_008100 [Tephrocybe rancida]|nr:hypothetical protein DXG01_008100 [Tephrocybe rancida]